MPKKIAPTKKQVSALILHAIIFTVVNAALWVFYSKTPLRVDVTSMGYPQGVEAWAYPWPIWITAAWGLSLIGHWASLFTNYEDAGNKTYMEQAAG